MQKGHFLHDYTCLAIVAIYCITTWLDLLCMYTGWQNCGIIFSFGIFSYPEFRIKVKTHFSTPKGFMVEFSIQQEYFPNLLENWFLWQILIIQLATSTWSFLNRTKFESDWTNLSFPSLFQKSWGKYSF